MNRNTIKTALLSLGLLGILLLPGCKKSSPTAAETIAGEWHLVSFEGREPSGFDAYLDLGADGTFILWQKVQSPRWQKYTGTYSAEWEILEGAYSDGTPWGSSYEYEHDGSAGRLVLTSIGEIRDTQEYLKQAVPDEVRENAEPVTKALGIEGGRLL